jgi:predicted transcriptional regulator
MKVLSLKQPFAELILQGKKTIELRKWNTKFRGEFLIHSSKIPDKKAMKQFGFNEKPLGFIIGKAILVDVKEYKTEKEFNADKHLHLATSEFGKFGFILSHPKRINPIIPAKGSLNFWNFNKKPKKLSFLHPRPY